MPKTPVLVTRFAEGWPRHEGAPEVEYVELGEALEREWPTDAHLAAYSEPERPHRLTKDAPAALGRSVAMVLAVFDFDDPEKVGGEARVEWSLAERAKVERVFADAGAGYAYATRGGYRIVYQLGEPLPVGSGPAGGAAWSDIYKGWIRLLARRWGIAADPACCDWTRVYRLPRSTRGDEPEVPLWELGDPRDVAAWAWEFEPGDLAMPARPRPESVPEEADTRLRGDRAGMTLAEREAACRRYLAEIAPSVEGEGGDARLFEAACTAVRGHALPSDVARAAIAEVFNPRCRPPWDASRIDHKIREASRESYREYGYLLEGENRAVAEMLAQKARAKAVEHAEQEEPFDLVLLDTDTGVGRRAAAKQKTKIPARRRGDQFRYLADQCSWLIWLRDHWERAEEGDLLAYAQWVANNLYADDVASGRDPAAARKNAVRAGSLSGLRNMIAVMSSRPELRVRTGDLNARSELLSVANGVVDLRDGSLRPHDLDDLLTQHSSVAYDPSATAPRWDRFLEEVFLGDEELISWVRRAAGYSLTGETREQCFFLMHGEGGNGKGRFVRQLMALAGTAGQTSPFSTFASNKHGDDFERNTPHLAELADARVVAAGELDQGVRLSEAMVKALTGEDRITACRKYERPFQFTPRFKIWLHCNHLPVVRGRDDGLWRRVRLVPFLAKFSGKTVDPLLDAKLDAERPGILAWAVRGAREWYERGLGDCRAVRLATADYCADSDPLAAFIEECIERIANVDSFTTNARIYAAYELWCKSHGTKPLDGRNLSKEFVRKGFRADEQKHKRGFLGIRIRELMEKLNQTAQK